MTDQACEVKAGGADALRRVAFHPAHDAEFLRARLLDAATHIEALTAEVLACRAKMAKFEKESFAQERQRWAAIHAESKSALRAAQQFIERGGSDADREDVLCANGGTVDFLAMK